MPYLDIAAIIIAGIALAISFMSWRAAKQSTRAAIHDRRYEIYEAAERFISIWLREGQPDLDALGPLVGAWIKSHFLCRKEVTRYLRQLWLDAVQADKMTLVAKGEVPGDRQKAIEQKWELINKYSDYEGLREVFMDDLRV